jgi:hypothetical protein
LAEFVQKLLAETMDAILTSQTTQEKRIAELAIAAESPLEAISAQLNDEAVDGLLLQLFGVSRDGKMVIAAGGAYAPATAESAESPPIEALLGLKLGPGDFAPARPETTAPVPAAPAPDPTQPKRLFILTPAGVARIRAAGRLALAKVEQQTAKAIIRRGPARLMVDHGQITVKASFTVAEDKLAAPVAGAPRRLEDRARQLRILVRPADARDPATARLTANLFGEVSLSLKAVG